MVQEISSEAVEESFFVAVPIVKFSSIDCPCIEIEIENSTFCMELDLGLRGGLALAPNLLEHLQPKTFLETSPMYGFRGTEYLTQFYRIPEIKIGNMFIEELTAQEEQESFHHDSTFAQKGQECSAPEHVGRVGWHMFSHINLLLDMEHSQIAFCDSVETLKTENYPTENFVQVPLFIERGFVEFDVTTPDGPMRCILDTGATWNFLNTELIEGQTIEDAMWDPDQLLDYSFLKIGNRDFGPITFTRIPINFPIHVEAILGMEFIRDHLIFLDFEGRSVYIQKASLR